MKETALNWRKLVKKVKVVVALLKAKQRQKKKEQLSQIKHSFFVFQQIAFNCT
jgi:hypothetical protein